MMNHKNYKTTSIEHFINLWGSNSLKFSLNILEIKPKHYTQYYKKISKVVPK